LLNSSTLVGAVLANEKVCSVAMEARSKCRPEVKVSGFTEGEEERERLVHILGAH
jgi:hypothetical protein